MWYKQSTQTIPMQQTYWYSTHQKGEIWYYSFSNQCVYPTVPPYIPNSSPQESISFLYNDVFEYVCNHDCNEEVGAGE